jgi:hypothetical protein
VPGGTDSLKTETADAERDLRRFFHDLATPLSGASLHLERASRMAARGEDPEEALSTARRELHRAFELFERGRAELLKP